MREIGAIILAAGAAARWGGATPKPLAEWRGETLVDRVARIAREAGWSPVVRVLGAHAEAILARPVEAGVSSVVHAEWATGMGGSIARGVEALLALRADLAAVGVLPVDQPLIEAADLRALANGLASSGRSIARCDYGNGEGGPPTIFLRAHFDALRALRGDEGAKPVVRAAGAGEVYRLRLEAARWDVDRVEALQKLAEQESWETGSLGLKGWCARAANADHQAHGLPMP